MPKLPVMGSLPDSCSLALTRHEHGKHNFRVPSRGRVRGLSSLFATEVALMDWGKIHDKALEWANTSYPKADPNHHQAFANAVAYLVTGTSGGAHGPSIREHLVSWSLMGTSGKVGDIGGMTAIYPDGTLPRAGGWRFGDACQFASPLCFDPPEKYLDELIQISGQEHCFDDAEADIAALKKR